MTNILTEELRVGAREFIISCQTCEGGFGGEPGNEAHGGYAFCAFASLLILGEGMSANVEALEDWVVHRQMGFEGKFIRLALYCHEFLIHFFRGVSRAHEQVG
jgi:protein farnesyltransferase subunit beta